MPNAIFFPWRAFAEQGQSRDNFVQEDKNYGVWFDLLFELFKIRDSFRPDLATEPLVNVPVTDCNDLSHWRPHLKRENEKATTQQSCSKLLKRHKQGHASFPREDIKKSKSN